MILYSIWFIRGEYIQVGGITTYLIVKKHCQNLILRVFLGKLLGKHGAT
jgi:hypothetical protein